MIRPPRILQSALASGLLLLACSSAPPPEPPRKREVILVNEEIDKQVGADVAAQVAAEMRFVDDPALQAYINAVGQRLAAGAPRGRYEYRFHLVDQDAPNAFALPGGFVYVSRGLIILSNSEDELANVIGHEITHVAARHAAARQEMARTQKNPLMLPGVVLGAVLGDKVGKATTAPFQAFNAPYIAKYGREQERAADRGGQKMAGKAGYDPRGMSTFLRGLNESERYRLGFSRLPSFLDTHPLTAERVGATASEAGLLVWTPSPPISTQEEYLRRLEGLVVGQSASEGVIQGQRFLHPDLDFTLEFPRGWKVINSDLAVGAVPPKRDAQVFLSAPTKGDDPRAAGEAFLAEHRHRVQVQIESEQDLTIGDLFSAYRLEGSAATAYGRVAGQITWIAYDGRVYRLTGVGLSGTVDKYIGRIRTVERSFRPLTSQEKGSIEENRLRLAKARSGETLVELGERSGNVMGLHQTAILNDHPTSKPLEAGRLIKIARSEKYRPPRKPTIGAAP
jgi:predicted Zn-dependent protease